MYVRNCSVPLITCPPQGVKEIEKWIIFIYRCVDQSHEGDEAESKESRFQTTTVHFSVILIYCRNTAR